MGIEVMANPVSDPITITADRSGQTVAAVLRSARTGLSWSAVRRLIATNHLRLNGELCLDPARRVKEGDAFEILDRPQPVSEAVRVELIIRHLDEHVVVVEKPAGINTVRHPAEREWSEKRRALSPTLEDRLQWTLGTQAHRPVKSLPRLRIVHRLDKETSGLVVFARTPLAERELGRQFHAHSVIRRYLALVPGKVAGQSVRTFLVRDRGDGRRGSTSLPGVGKEAVTHFDVVEHLLRHTLLTCRLETGRTHQIRIHLAELGHPVCGEPVYNCRTGGAVIVTPDDCPRLFLHAAELGFQHPATSEAMHWEMPLPEDLSAYLAQQRR